MEKSKAMNKIEIAKRAIVTKPWRWVEGMLTMHGCRVLQVNPDGLVRYTMETAWRDFSLQHTRDTSKWLPNLGDDATLGCVWGLVRKAWDGYNIDVTQERSDCCIFYADAHGKPGTQPGGIGYVPFDELSVVALEAAPWPLTLWAIENAPVFAKDIEFLRLLRDDPDGLGGRYIWRLKPPKKHSLRECCDALLRVLEPVSD